MSFKKSQLFPSNPQTTRGESTKLGSHNDKLVYTNGRLVIIRDLHDPGKTVSYSGHVHPATVARISPSGYYCASADTSGLVKVWDTVGEDQVLKMEVKSISGKIKDVAWDGESKRIIAVGDGKERFGSVFMIDTGSSAGEVSGHSKTVNTVAIRNQRPFRAVSGADDSSIVFYQGAPYKFDKTIKTHSRFVQDVRYAPSGGLFASAGADGKVFLYDGKTGETVAELQDAHKGSVMALGWSPDSKSFITSSADCTTKLWDVETRQCITAWALGTGVEHQQVGNTWAGTENLVSLSMSGHLNVFDRRVGDKPSRILYGHQKGITSGILSRDEALFVGAYDGRVLSYGESPADSPQPVGGEGHKGQVVALASGGEHVFSVGFDDRLRELDPKKRGFTDTVASLGSQPRSLSVSGSQTIFISTLAGIDVFDDGKISSHKINFDSSAVTSTANGLVAIGGQDSKIRLFNWEGGQLSESAQLEGHRAQVTALAFSPDGSLLVGGDTAGKVVLFDVATRKLVTGRWTSHSARINSLAWTADGKHIASGSLDTHVYIWSIDNPGRNIALKNVVPGGVSLVAWLNDTTLAAGGADACIRNFSITFHK